MHKLLINMLSKNTTYIAFAALLLQSCCIHDSPEDKATRITSDASGLSHEEVIALAKKIAKQNKMNVDDYDVNIIGYFPVTVGNYNDNKRTGAWHVDFTSKERWIGGFFVVIIKDNGEYTIHNGR